jgi:hypothetical protein
MSDNRFVFSGLDELRAELRAMPADMTGEASHEVEGAANGAAADIMAIYGAHHVTGHLQDSVFVIERHWVSGKSTGTMWGKTPPTHAFVKTMIAARRKMYDRLKNLLVRHGLTVSGDA